MLIKEMMDSDSEESFKSFHDDNQDHGRASSSQEHGGKQPRSSSESNPHAASPTLPAAIERFSPEEEASLLAESNSLKGSGNQQFGAGAYSSALQTYDRALASCPNYLDFELAVLRANVAACRLKLAEWQEAVASAEQGLAGLERLEPLPRAVGKKASAAKAKGAAEQVVDDGNDDDDDDGDLVHEVDDAVAQRIENLQRSGRTLDEVRKLQVKLLMRRARARMELGGWAALQGADEDYRTLLLPAMQPVLSGADRRAVVQAAQQLGPRLDAAKQHEMAEMMGKLKGLGNSILKPFGLSTENFQFVKDEKSGGYSMNFTQNPGTQ